jgi:lipoprotein-anchoring transpeptidase ErfK/SrfK
MPAKRLLVILAIVAPLTALAVAIGLLVSPGTRANADAVAQPSRPPLHKPAPVVAAAARPAAPKAPQIDQGMVLKRVLDTGGPIRFGDWFWDDKDVPAGPVVITVDLKAQVLSIFRAGYEIGTAAIIYGADDKPTPLGTFPILQKDADHKSSTYWGAPMPYMQRLTWDGVSIHGAPIDPTYATHGCIGVPKPFARKLFGATRIGDKVIVTDGKMIAGAGGVPTDQSL